jgi:hypothetical protein
MASAVLAIGAMEGALRGGPALSLAPLGICPNLELKRIRGDQVLGRPASPPYPGFVSDYTLQQSVAVNRKSHAE